MSTVLWNDCPLPLTPKRYWPVDNRWHRSETTGSPPSSIQLISWNVDFMAPNAGERIYCILYYLQHLVLVSTSFCPPSPPCILLQEVSKEGFDALLSHEWVRSYFTVVPACRSEWPAGATYGNVTLVSITVPVRKAISVVFGNSSMRRNAVLVDLDLLDPSWGPPLVMRIANTHLESLPQGTPVRPGQLALISRLLKQPDVDGGVVGGDMNAIAPNDACIHLDAGLLDAYTGHPNEHNGFTWGYQPPSKYPPARLDKLFYTPEIFGDPPRIVRVHPPELVGETLITSRGQWASDHYGLRTCVHFTQVAR